SPDDSGAGAQASAPLLFGPGASGRNWREMAIRKPLSPPHGHWTLIAFTGTSAFSIMHLDRSGSDLQGGHHAFARAPHTRPHASSSPTGARHGAADLPSGASLRPSGREGGRAALRGLPQIQLETVGQ